MATQSKKVTTKGLCDFCEGEFDKARMTQHLKHCKQRAVAIADDPEDETAQNQKVFHILVEGKYNPQYWMHLEIPATEPLEALDSFLRDIWVECCSHLSSFTIDGTSYADEPDYPEAMSFEMMGSPVRRSGFEVEEEEDDLIAEEVEGEEEDLSLEEIEEEEDDLSPEEIAEEVGKWLDEALSALQITFPARLDAELRKPRSRDDLVAFLKEELKPLPDVFSLAFSGTLEENRNLYYQKHMLATLLGMVEDTSLGVSLERVLKVGQKFTYMYDFGSTTYLNLRVVSEREGVILVEDEDDFIATLARNVPPVILCKRCGKPAEKVVAGYFNVEENAYCNKCVRYSGEDREMMVPIVNSPRMGVCGYSG